MTIEAVARLALPEQASVSRFHPLTQKRMLWLRKRRRRQRRRPRRQRKPRRSSFEGSGGASRSAWARRADFAKTAGARPAFLISSVIARLDRATQYTGPPRVTPATVFTGSPPSRGRQV